MITLRTNAAAQTHALGKILGARLRPGDTVLLQGSLGAGKSVLARGIAEGLGVKGPLPSPSFPILLVHEGKDGPLYHMDLYRLEDEEEAYAIGLEEYIGGDGVALVEWPERAWGLYGPRVLHIDIDYGPQEGQRELHICPKGPWPPAWLRNLEEAL